MISFFTKAPVSLSTLFHKDPLYVTRKGANKEPIIKIKIAMPSVKRPLLKGERKYPKVSIGRIVKETKINLLGVVILCVVSHSLQLIGL